MNLEEMLEAVKSLPEGDYAECGVWKGYSAAKIASLMTPETNLWLLDSFRGHGEPSEFDDAKRHPKGRYADTSVRDVWQAIPVCVPRKRVVIVRGFIPETLPVASNHRFRFLHIDLDHYLPTKAACEFFRQRMVPGGIIRFDDYGFAECPGVTKAVDEVFGRENVLPNDFRWVQN